MRTRMKSRLLGVAFLVAAAALAETKPVVVLIATGEVNRALARPEVAGVIVSHGTDTLEETAYWLDLTVDSDKPVVLTGAQRNASESDFDGPRNRLNAIRIAVDPQSKGKGAVLAMFSRQKGRGKISVRS